MPQTISLPSIVDTSISSLQSYTTAVLNERMWHFRGPKHTMTPPTYFQGSRPQITHDLRPCLYHCVVISRPWSRDSSALEFILSKSRSWSRDLMAQVSVLVSRPEDPGLAQNTLLTTLHSLPPRSWSWDLKKVLTTTLLYHLCCCCGRSAVVDRWILSARFTTLLPA